MSAPEMRRIGGIDVAVFGRDEALRQVVDRVVAHTPQVIGFANAHTVNMARTSREFAGALRDALVLNDGAGVNLASKLVYGLPFPDNLNGTDLTPQLLTRLPAGTRVYLVGSKAAIATLAAEKLQRRHPHLLIVGAHDGFFSVEEESDLAREIVEARADVVLAGMGHPRQELWAARNVATLGIPVICIGAFLDFTAGVVHRAPTWMRRTSLEWLYRLLQEPRRLARRYLLGNCTFLIAISGQALRQRRAH
jgi:exopolysaccharide biosynthesis WecB/TagA/CpsF family protein